MPSDSFDLDDLDKMAPPTGGDARPADQNVAPSHAPNYLEGLNEPQLEAVLAVDGPLLVLAGAGTGKTRVLTTRLGHLLATGRAAPWNILAVTFTNKASKEMQHRVTQVLGRPIEGMWIGTFHSICVKILRRHADRLGLQSNFTILDMDDQLRLLKQLVKLEGIDDKRWPAKQLAGLIDRWKNKALTPDKIPENEGFSYAEGKGVKLYKAYQDQLKMINATDFGDLIMLCIKLFQDNPDILAQYHNQFKYMLVDEYQDTNVAQYLWLRLLAQKNHNVCCVGDDDQSIYGWRGAEVGNILRFSDDFPGAKVVRLEQNYRSTGHILAAASSLIATNQGRLGKTLWTDSGDGEKVMVRGVWDGPEEARVVCDEIESLQTKQVNLKEVAILVRTGAQMREFEERFLTLGIPYRVVGGPRFYERAEIRDALAYLRVIAQPNDDLAFERIVNQPKRGIGKASIQKLHVLGREQGITMGYAVHHANSVNLIKGKASTSLTSLLADFDRWRALSHNMSPKELLQTVLEESGYLQMHQDDVAKKDVKAEGRIENLKEMVSALDQYDSLAEFLEHVSLVMENEKNTDQDKATIMTFHAAKGLEFDHVFLAGWEEKLFPSERAMNEIGHKALEEERRLAYVGITRARVKAYISHAGTRQIFGQWQSCMPSRFIEELPEAHIEIEASSGIYGSQNRFKKPEYDDNWGSSDYQSKYERTPNIESSPKSKSGYKDYGTSSFKDNEYRGSWNKPEVIPKGDPRNRFKATSQKKAAPKKKATSKYTIGERVFHEKFGYGNIEEINGTKLQVAFEKSGDKSIMDNFVRKA